MLQVLPASICHTQQLWPLTHVWRCCGTPDSVLLKQKLPWIFKCILLVFIYFFMVLEIQPRALHVLSYTEPQLSPKCILLKEGSRQARWCRPHNPSTQEAMAGRSWVQGQPDLHSKTLPPKKKKKLKEGSDPSLPRIVCTFSPHPHLHSCQRQEAN
jgi:hypothetical protein